MKTTIMFITAVLLVTARISMAASEKDQVIDREEAAWQAYKDKKAEEFRKMIADNYRGVYSDEVYTVDGEMSALREADIKSFSLSRLDVVSIDADTVMVTYLATMQATQGGKDVSGTYNAASVWQKQGGSWKVVLHTNVRQEKPK